MRNLVKDVCTLLASSFVALILCEIILRVAGISYPVFDTYDELRGVSLRPSKEGWYRNEGEAYLRINSHGYRDVEHAIEKPPGTFRIAVLGDSFTEARQVALEDTFWSYLGKNIGTCNKLLGRKIEILNFGIGGYGTTQEFLTLKHHVWRFDPDLVLLAVFTGNDIVDNSKEMMSTGSLRGDFRPFHVIENGKLVLDNSFRQFGAQFLWKRYLLYEGVHHLRILELANRARHIWKSKPPKKPALDDASRAEVNLSPEVYLPPKTNVWKEAWLITEELFSRINQEVDEHSAIFILATLSTEIQVHPDAELRDKYKIKNGLADLFYPERRIRSIGKKYGFPVITIAEPLQQAATSSNIFLHGFTNTEMGKGHWNELGHRLAGEILVEEICAKLQPPTMKIVN